MSKTTESFEVLTSKAIEANINDVIRSGNKINEMIEKFSKALAISNILTIMSKELDYLRCQFQEEF